MAHTIILDYVYTVTKSYMKGVVCHDQYMPLILKERKHLSQAPRFPVTK